MVDKDFFPWSASFPTLVCIGKLRFKFFFFFSVFPNFDDTCSISMKPAFGVNRCTPKTLDSGYECLPFRVEFRAFHFNRLVLVRKTFGMLCDWVLQSSSHFAVVRFCTELATFPYVIHQSLSSSNCVHLGDVRAWTRGATFSDRVETTLLTACLTAAKKYVLLCKRSSVLLAV